MTDAAAAPASAVRPEETALESVTYQVDGPVALIAFNRPDSLNAIEATIRRDFMAAAEAAEADPAVRAVVLAGEGRGFCAGADLRDAAVGEDVRGLLLQGYKPTLDFIAASGKPWIAAIHGACAGIGASYAMQCDLAVMEESAYMYEAFAAIGLVPDGGAHWHLVRALGYKRAYAAIVGAEKIPASVCETAGLVNRVVPEGEARAAAMAMAAQLAQGAPRTLRHAKSILRAAQAEGFDANYEREADAQADCSNSKDARNAIAAFFAKKKPVFTGE